MNYVWGFVNYFYGEKNELLEIPCVKEFVDELYSRYKMRVNIQPFEEKVKEGQSGFIEVTYNYKKILLTLSIKKQELFTLGGKGMCQFGSKRNKDEFYKVVQMELV